MFHFHLVIRMYSFSTLIILILSQYFSEELLHCHSHVICLSLPKIYCNVQIEEEKLVINKKVLQVTLCTATHLCNLKTKSHIIPSNPYLIPM